LLEGKNIYSCEKQEDNSSREEYPEEGHNMRRTFYGSKKTKKSLKNITASETIMLKNGKI